MRINATGSVGGKPAANRTRTARGGADRSFASALEGGGAVAETPAGVVPLAGVGPLLFAQEIAAADTLSGQAMGAADDMLDRLDQLRHSLLVGAIPLNQLKELQEALDRRRRLPPDPRLGQILDEIEIRTAVEIAKLECLVDRVNRPQG